MSAVMEQFAFDLGGAAEELVMFEPSDLEPWPDLNPRWHFDAVHMEELQASIRENGVLQNIVVHDRGSDAEGGKRYWIVIGETRWRAATAVGKRLPARVRVFTLAQAHRLAMLENMQRANLLPREEGRGFKRELELNPHLTQEQLGAVYGRDQSYVSNRIRLLELPESVGELVDSGIIPPTFARDHLMRWLGEENADALFTALVQMVATRPHPDESVQRVWLIQVVEQLTMMLGTKQETVTPAAAPSPANKSATKASTKKPEPPKKQKQVKGAAPASEGGSGDEPASGVEPDTQDPADESDVLPDVGEPEAGETAESEPETAQDAGVSASEDEAASARGDDAAQEPTSEATHEGDAVATDAAAEQEGPIATTTGDTSAEFDALPPADENDDTELFSAPAAGLLAAMTPLMEEYSVTMQIMRPPRAEHLMVTLTPHKLKGRTSVAPLTLQGDPGDLDRRLPEAVLGYVSTLTEEDE